jgi:hypothetical protein
VAASCGQLTAFYLSSKPTRTSGRIVHPRRTLRRKNNTRASGCLQYLVPLSCWDLHADGQLHLRVGWERPRAIKGPEQLPVLHY